MYGPMSGEMVNGRAAPDLVAKMSEPCRITQTKEQFEKLEKELGRLNELQDSLEHMLAPILRGEPNQAGIKNDKERAQLVPLAESLSRFCDQANATGNALESILRRIEL